MRNRDKITENISRNLRREMVRRGISGSELARRSGLSPMGVSNIINGRRHPFVGSLLAIASVLETTVERLANPPAKPRKRAS